jgi:hypothetical protein
MNRCTDAPHIFSGILHKQSCPCPITGQTGDPPTPYRHRSNEVYFTLNTTTYGHATMTVHCFDQACKEKVRSGLVDWPKRVIEMDPEMLPPDLVCSTFTDR